MSLLKIFNKESNNEDPNLAVFDFFGTPPKAITQTESEVFGNIQKYSRIYVNKDDTISFKLKLSVASKEAMYVRWVNIEDNGWVKKGVQNGDITTLYVKMF